MPHWRISPQVDAQISLDDTSADTPTYHGDDRITGKAVYTLKKPYEGLRYRVLIRGNVQTKTVDQVHGSLNSFSNYDTHNFVSASIFDGHKSAKPTENGKLKVEIPFKFMLQNQDNDAASCFSGSTLSGTTQSLLPSLDSKDGSRHWSDAFKSEPAADYQITYTIIASAVIDKKTISSNTKRFQFLPRSSLDPVPVEDFPGEYTLRTSNVLKQKGSRSSTRIGVISQEPPAIAFHSGEKRSRTSINLLFMLSRDAADRFQTAQLPKTLNVKAHLRATTFVMPQKCRPELHTMQAAHFSKAAVKQGKSNAQSQTVGLKSWESSDSESDDDKNSTGEEIFTNSTTIPFLIENEAFLAPNFWSPLLSRRYAIDLAVTFDDDASTTTKLRLPVQVVHEP